MTLPRDQGRVEWTGELRAVLAEAKRRGDSRPSGVIVAEWLAFRQQHTDARPAP